MSWSPPPFSIPWARSVLCECKWAEDVMEFDGPKTCDVLGIPYATLTHGGIKPEGAPIAGPLIWNPAEAWHLFLAQFAQQVAGARQIAWRWPPELKQEHRGNWVVTARLAWTGMEPN